MSDEEQVMAKLELYIVDMALEEQELARTVCAGLFREAGEASAKSGALESLKGRLTLVKEDFDNAYSRLEDSMGL